MADDDITKATVAPPGAPKAPIGGTLTPSAVGPVGNPTAGPMGEIGVSGLHVFSGYVNEEYLPELQGWQARKIYRQMSEGDPICAAMLAAIALILRAVDWRIEPANDSAEAEKQAEFVQQCFDDMSQPFPDFIGEALSMLPFGWAYHEIVLKRRVGPDQDDPSKRSKYTDGRIGIRKLAIRSQDSLQRWEMQADGGINGMWQLPPQGGQLLLIPIERALLFRTTSRKNNPEGVSILRAAYRPWYIKKTVEDHEAIGVERELAGLPIVSIPNKYLAANATSEEKAAAQRYMTIARDLKFNQQAGIVIPSDTYPNPDGTWSANRLVDIKLLSTGGRRAIETSPIIDRYNKDIARSALADFIMLGDSKGSYALSKNKSELFLRACETFLNQFAEPINRYLIPRLFQYNGIDPKLMPEAKPGRVAPVDLAELGTFIQQLGAAGAPLFPDEPLEDYLREIADLPEPSPEAHSAAMMGLAASTQMQQQRAQGGNVDQDGNPVDNMSFGEDDATSSFFSSSGGPSSGGGAKKGFIVKGHRGGSQTSGYPFYRKYDPSEPRDAGGKWTSGGAENTDHGENGTYSSSLTAAVAAGDLKYAVKTPDGKVFASTLNGDPAGSGYNQAVAAGHNSNQLIGGHADSQGHFFTSDDVADEKINQSPVEPETEHPNPVDFTSRTGSFASNEVDALSDYGDGMHDPINKLLLGEVGTNTTAGGLNSLANKVHALDTAIAKEALTQDVVVYRGMGAHGAFADPAQWVGKSFEVPTFISTSTDPNIASAFSTGGISIELHVLKGTPAVAMPPWSGHVTENELLLPRNGMMHVQSVKQVGGRTNIVAAFQPTGKLHWRDPSLISGSIAKEENRLARFVWSASDVEAIFGAGAIVGKAFNPQQLRDAQGRWTSGGAHPSTAVVSTGAKRTEGWTASKIRVVKSWMQKATTKDGIKEIAGHLHHHATKKENIEKGIAYAINTAISHATPPNLWGGDERDVIKAIVTDFSFTVRLTHSQAKDFLSNAVERLIRHRNVELAKAVGDDDPVIEFLSAFKAAIDRDNGVTKAAKTLYVSRPVVNDAELSAWAKSQGLTTTLTDMHVTIAFSRAPVDWATIKPDVSQVTIRSTGDRSIAAIGANGEATALCFSSAQLADRHQEFKAAGATWDWASFQPHITLTYDAPAGADRIEPYAGPIVLGPEVFDTIKDFEPVEKYNTEVPAGYGA